MLNRQLGFAPLTAMIAIGVFAGPAAAQESETVPPDNSAATQYTEAFPTAGGDRDAQGHDRRRTPREALGAGKARELERHRPGGEEVAELVAETAPADAPNIASRSTEFDAAGPGRGAATGEGDIGERPVTGRRNPDDGAAAAGDSAAGGDSSGVGSVVSAALGSSGGSGVLLPLALLLTAVWAILYGALRGRRTAG